MSARKKPSSWLENFDVEKHNKCVKDSFHAGPGRSDINVRFIELTQKQSDIIKKRAREHFIDFSGCLITYNEKRLRDEGPLQFPLESSDLVIGLVIEAMDVENYCSVARTRFKSDRHAEIMTNETAVLKQDGRSLIYPLWHDECFQGGPGISHLHSVGDRFNFISVQHVSSILHFPVFNV